MRGFRGGMLGGLSLGSLLSGIMSFKVPNIPDFFSARSLNAPTPFREHRATRKVKRRPAQVHRGWRPMYFDVAGANSQEAERRRRQIAAGSLRAENGLVS